MQLRPGHSAALLADRQRRWRAGHRIVTEDFFALYPSARLDPELAVQLIHQEYRLLAEAGAEPAAEEFLGRFPEFAGALAESFQQAALRNDSKAKVAAPHLLGRYLLRRPLGESERGMIYKAIDTRHGGAVAVKVLKLRAGELPRAALVSLQRDLPRLIELQHPNVCRIHALRYRGAEPYLVREYVRGASLADWLREHHRVRDIRRAAGIIAKAARGLAALHAAGIAHGNVKPSNVLVDRAFDARLSDPGLIPGPPPGNSDYVALDPLRAPELAAADRTTLTADVFALGVIAHRLITGAVPDGNSPMYHRPDLDPMLDGIIKQAIAKNPRDRFPSAREFAAALASSLKRTAFW